jgi:hypothetical protein
MKTRFFIFYKFRQLSAAITALEQSAGHRTAIAQNG